MECVLCGKTIYGRTDKRFCDLDCRNSYHNSRRSSHERPFREMHKKLMVNYRILKRLYERGERTVDIHSLREYGFNPTSISYYRRFERQSVMACYDQFFIYVDDTRLLLMGPQTEKADLDPGSLISEYQRQSIFTTPNNNDLGIG